MELKLHRHGIRIALASVFGAMLTATPLVGDSAIGEWHRDGKSVLVSSLDGPDGNRYDRNNRVRQEEGDFILTAGRAVAPLCRGHTRNV